MLYRTAVAICLFLLIGCKGDDYLRGEVVPSEDGKTYFSVLDDNGGMCGPIYVNGVRWLKPLDEYREVQPGDYAIKCGEDGPEIYFQVPAGVKFGFDYWGP